MKKRKIYICNYDNKERIIKYVNDKIKYEKNKSYYDNSKKTSYISKIIKLGIFSIALFNDKGARSIRLGVELSHKSKFYLLYSPHEKTKFNWYFENEILSVINENLAKLKICNEEGNDVIFYIDDNHINISSYNDNGKIKRINMLNPVKGTMNNKRTYSYIGNRMTIYDDKRPIVSKKFNDDGKCIKIKNYIDDTITKFTYDSNGNMIKSVKSNSDYIENYVYDSNSRLIEKVLSEIDVNGCSIDILKKEYIYNNSSDDKLSICMKYGFSKEWEGRSETCIETDLKYNKIDVYTSLFDKDDNLCCLIINGETIYEVMHIKCRKEDKTTDAKTYTKIFYDKKGRISKIVHMNNKGSISCEYYIYGETFLENAMIPFKRLFIFLDKKKGRV